MSQEKPAYVLVDVRITNSENYDRYKSLAKPLIEKFGGEYLTRGGEMDVVLQDLWKPTRLVLVKFPIDMKVELLESFLFPDKCCVHLSQIIH